MKGLRPDRSVIGKVNLAVRKLNKALQRNKIKAVAVVGGSLAKGTFIKGDYDVDLFVKFDYSYKDKDISKILGKVLKKAFPRTVLVHGSRDYFQIKGKINYEIVPVLDITDAKKAINVTDMSPMHVEWVKKHNYVDDIRLAKQFCKAQNCYGAESYIKGFSGHVLDILTIYYKGFTPLVKAAAKWKPKVVIDHNNYYKGKAIEQMNISKIQSPLIVIDPILPERNAAAALSLENFNIFVDAANRFIKKQSKEFFVKKEITIAELKKKAKNNKLVLLDVESLKGKEDIIGGKLLKAFTFIKNQLKFHDFRLIEAGWEWDKEKNALFWFITDKKDLSEYKEHIGPPLKAKEFAEEFRKKHKDVFIKNKRLYAKVKRDFTKAEDFVKYLIKEKYIREKVKNINKK